MSNNHYAELVLSLSNPSRTELAWSRVRRWLMFFSVLLGVLTFVYAVIGVFFLTIAPFFDQATLVWLVSISRLFDLAPVAFFAAMGPWVVLGDGLLVIAWLMGWLFNDKAMMRRKMALRAAARKSVEQAGGQPP